MRLLVSDYDGTIFDQDNLNESKRNIKAIKEFKNKGNMFTIATGRFFTSIKEQTEKYHIPYDYLICNNGGTLFNQNDELIYTNPIEEQQVILIINYLQSLPYIKDIKLIDSFGNYTTNTKDTHQIYIKVYIKNTLDLLKIKKELSSLQYYGILNIGYIYKQTDKTDGIKIIQQLEQIQLNDIHTIGNANNDIQMLQEYNGSRVPYSYPKLVFKRIPKNSITNLIKKIESGNI